MEERKPLTGPCSCNGPTSMSVDGNKMLLKKAAKKAVKYGTTEDHDSPLWPRRSVIQVVDSDAIFGQIFLK